MPVTGGTRAALASVTAMFLAFHEYWKPSVKVRPGVAIVLDWKVLAVPLPLRACGTGTAVPVVITEVPSKKKFAADPPEELVELFWPLHCKKTEAVVGAVVRPLVTIAMLTEGLTIGKVTPLTEMSAVTLVVAKVTVLGSSVVALTRRLVNRNVLVRLPGGSTGTPAQVTAAAWFG